MTSILLSALFLTAGAGALEARKPQVRMLSNGLTVILYQDAAQGDVGMHVRYKVGSKNEEQYLTGLAHAFEHIMFRGSRDVADGEYDGGIAKCGGMSNAFTANDMTHYFARFLPECMEKAFKMEANRMGWLAEALDDGKWTSERDVVIRELEQRSNGAYATAGEHVFEHAFGKEHPYGHPPVGYLDDLKRETPQNAGAFFKKHYMPNNAIFALAGNFDPKLAWPLIVKYFGAVPAGQTPGQPSFPRFQLWDGRREQVVPDSQAQLPLLFLTYHIPGVAHEDVRALEILGQVLSSGRNSRLHQALVVKNRIALQVGASAEGLQQDGLFVMTAMLAPGIDPKKAEAAIYRVVAQLIKEGVSKKELARIRNRMETDKRNALQDAIATGMALVGGVDERHDVMTYEKDIEYLNRLDPAAVGAVAGKYIQPVNSAVTLIKPVPPAGGGK